MYYFWIPIALLFIAALCSDTSTWSPFQSGQVKEICAHMTRAERRAAMNRGARWGLLLGGLFGTAAFLGMVVFGSTVAFLAGFCLVFPLVFSVQALAQRKGWWPDALQSPRDFLASTDWAKSQGLKADDIRLYRWQE